MGSSINSESEDGVLTTDSHPSNDSDNFGGSLNVGIVLKKGPWTSAEDAILVDYVKKHGEGNWNAVQKHSGLSRCGKSCRLRWANHLRPNLKKGVFTPEEEKLIIELHAKMGNKWARMAAHLPGRTDNEIKNYWNTRIKRRQRAGLPVYPLEICLQPLPENHQSLNSLAVCGGDKGCHGVLQTESHKAPDCMFDSLNFFPYTAGFPDISASGSLINGFGCPMFYNFAQTIGLQKHTQNPDELIFDYGGDAADEAPSFLRVHNDNYEDKVSQSFSPCFPYDPNHIEQLLLPGVNHNSHFTSNGFFSASKPFVSAEKLELPSLQYQETGLGAWATAPESVNSFGQSSTDGPLPSDCPSPRSSGLLEALLYEAKALSKSENQFSDKASSSTVSAGYIRDISALKTCSSEYKCYLDPGSPSSSSIGSFFNECIPSHTVGSSLEEKMPVQLVKSGGVDENLMLDGASKEILDQLDCSRPDVVLGSSSWRGQSASCFKQRSSAADSIAAFLSDDSGSELSMSVGTSVSNWAFSSCTLNNMPAVCQMSDHP